jgi:hypothetical protein
MQDSCRVQVQETICLTKKGFSMKQRAGLFLNKQEGCQKAGWRGGEHQFEDCSSQAGLRGKIFSMNL